MDNQSAGTTNELPDGLMSVGVEGFHPLFDAEWIRRAFNRLQQGGFDQGLLLSAHHAQRTLRSFTCLIAARQFLAGLPTGALDLLIYLYFRTLDQRISQTGRTLH